ncbi:MAG TPA: type II toxin-antitoxin system RelE/ParE family toxin [Steroidobacteraceae bacterium]|nr:type II toxin-antitoxin system RelE/ParE family toxin [Steroidobacteraceae bacterium]
MKLLLLGKGQWTVYAVCSGEETCPILDFITELDPKRGSKVLSDLQQFVPFSEPQDWVRIDMSWKLRGTEDILEFRWPTKKGGTPRVYWFYDEGRVVVCACGDNKKGDTKQEDIDAATSVRLNYFAAKQKNDLTVVTFEHFTASDDEEASNE